jgi:hypothetical protein
MKGYLPVLAALAVSQMSSTFVPSLKASESDEKTIIKTSQPIAVDGTVLPPGQYVLKLQESSINRNIIFIFNGNETQLITTIFAIHADRLEPTDKTEFSFYGPREGQPTALHTWFYPGEDSGFEFLQGK